MLGEEESVRHIGSLGKWLWRAGTQEEESRMTAQQRGEREQRNSNISGKHVEVREAAASSP